MDRGHPDRGSKSFGSKDFFFWHPDRITIVYPGMVLYAAILMAQGLKLDSIPLDPKLVGEWVTVATNGSDYKGYLWLTADGRFTEKFVPGRSQGRREKTETLSGRYVCGKIAREEDPRLKEVSSRPMVQLTISFEAARKRGTSPKEIEMFEKQGVENFPLQALFFEPSVPILYDMITVVFARKGEEAKIRKVLEQDRKG